MVDHLLSWPRVFEGTHAPEILGVRRQVGEESEFRIGAVRDIDIGDQPGRKITVGGYLQLIMIERCP